MNGLLAGEIAVVVAFLASGPAGWVSGQNIRVNGRTARYSVDQRGIQSSAAHVAHAASQSSLRGSRSVDTARMWASGARPARDIFIAQ
jgi:hypothetical protein